MLKTTLVSFLVVLLVGDMIIVRAAPVDNEDDAILDQLFNQNLVERRSHKKETGRCLSSCVSCSKYVGMIADRCIRGCIQNRSHGSINNAEVDAWYACEKYLYR